VGVPEGLNTHAHSEQPQPKKPCCSIHTSSRRMASLAHLTIRCGSASLKDGLVLVLDGTATTKIRSSLP
jgi:hypothetical protein